MTHILNWKNVSMRGNCKATGPCGGIYFIQKTDDGYQLTYQGNRLAKASTLQGAKDHALICANR